MIISDNSYEELSSKEWLITNGIGGYASSTVACSNTRRYHGILVASLNPPVDRRVIVSGLEEEVSADSKKFFLSSHQYPGAIHPQGFQHIIRFERDPFPKWIFVAEGYKISKTIFMIYGRNATVIEYENLSGGDIDIELTPLFVLRDYHHLRRETDGLDYLSKQLSPGVVEVSTDSLSSSVYLMCPQGNFTPADDWYRNFEYAIELQRGLDHTEDAKCLGKFSMCIRSRQKGHFIVSMDKVLPDGEPAHWKKHEELRLGLLCPGTKDPFIRDLIISGDQFLVWRLSSKSHTLIAGYPWFTDWGRDTMIAMRGLIISCGNKQIAESIFLTFLQYLDHGLIPNRFPDGGEVPEYNTIDATLWMFVALREYFEKFNDLEFITRIYASLELILDAHISGTRYNIHVNDSHLLYGGDPSVQLTWMDAKVDDTVVTPRHGCAVEINALWYNALRITCHFGKLLNKKVDKYERQAEQCQTSFRKYFLNEEDYLNDVVVPGNYVDAAIRPNQIYAISLPHMLLTEDESASILEVVEKHLYTDLGLRSLSPDDPQFKPIYQGGRWERDHAYHQGTVWSHLWGEYALAYLKVNHFSVEAKKNVREKAKALEQHFYNESCLYGISEIFDGGKPAAGKGCFHQAWSVGMTLKALLEAGDDFVK